MKEKLEQHEIELMEVVRNKWVKLAFDKCSEGINKPAFEEGIAWLYKRFLDLQAPQVIYCDSMLDAVMKITLVKDYGKELSDFSPKMMDDFHNGKLDVEFVEKIKENYSLKSTYIGWSNFGWVSFYDFFTQINVLNHEDFNNYQKLIESNVFECFEFENAVFAVQPPMEVVYNEALVPHNLEGASITFRDGSDYFHINGFSISEELFTKLHTNTYTFKDFISEDNEEIKSAVISYLELKNGSTGVYDFIKDNLKEIDTFVDKKADHFMEGTTKSMNVGVYTLFKGAVNDIDIAYVRCYCPSTDRMFFLGVDPVNKNAKDAIASLFRVPTVLKNNIKSISRQGEKFSIEFDEATIVKLKNNEYSKEELNTYTHVSGDEYFSLMKYEF
jgi:hypothetical protein